MVNTGNEQVAAQQGYLKVYIEAVLRGHQRYLFSGPINSVNLV